MLVLGPEGPSQADPIFPSNRFPHLWSEEHFRHLGRP